MMLANQLCRYYRPGIISSVAAFSSIATSSSSSSSSSASSSKGIWQQLRQARMAKQSEEEDEPVVIQNENKDVHVSINANFPVLHERQNRFSGDQEEMDLHFLGTSSGQPNFSRGTSAIGFRYNGSHWLFDCGEGTYMQLQKAGYSSSSISKIFISHLHGDHIFGIGAVLCFVGMSNPNLAEQSKGIDIYGPEGLADYLRIVTQTTQSRICIPYRIHELKNIPGPRYRRSPISTVGNARFGELERREIYPNSNGHYEIFKETEDPDRLLSVTAAPMMHTIPCVGYVIEEKTRMGGLNEKAVLPMLEKNAAALMEMHGVKYRSILKDIKALAPHESYTFPDGSIIYGRDASGSPIVGRKVVIMGDTCSGQHIADLARDADVLVHEATNTFIRGMYNSEMDEQRLEKATREKMHSTALMAGAFAAQIRAKQLVLTHFSPRYSGDWTLPAMRYMWAIEDIARTSSGLMGLNEVVAAWDTLKLPIPRARAAT